MKLPGSLLLGVWLALCFHGPLVAAGLFRFSYDAPIHLFFADHYRRAWFSLWEPRWFAGFSVSSYPPLVHQLLALLSFPLGYDGSFGLVLLVTLLVMPIALYRFGAIFVSPVAAGWAAVVGVFLPAVALAANDFGQLPTLVSLVLAMLFLAEYARFVESGDRRSLALVAALGGATTSAHHATSLLFLPPAMLACVAAIAITRRTSTAAYFRRAVAGGLAAAAVGILVVLPFWSWVATHPEQTPIPHPTRANLLADFDAQALFFWANYGVLPALALYGLAVGWQRRLVALLGLALLFGVLGLGGTTPLPSILFRSEWQWLTYDRYALWSSVAILPLAGLAAVHLLSRPGLVRRLTVVVSTAVLATYAVVGSILPLVGPTQPYQVDLAPLVAFLGQDDRGRWRYQTFGFGEGANRLGYLVTAPTIDGGYYSARRLPELTDSGIGQIDYALWWDPSGDALRRILAQADAYSIRWAFAGESRYRPYLEEAGFRRREVLGNGIEVWENEDAPPLPVSATVFGRPDAAGILWGTLPLLALFSAIALAVGRIVGRTGVGGSPSAARRQRGMGLPEPAASGHRLVRQHCGGRR